MHNIYTKKIFLRKEALNFTPAFQCTFCLTS